MHANIILISVHTNTESYTYTHEMKVQRRNGKTPFGTRFGIRRWTSKRYLAL